MLEEQLATLRCPYCYGPLQHEREVDVGGIHCAIVRCPCSRFPVIEGVVALDRKPGEWFAGNPSLLRLVEARDAGALEQHLLQVHQVPAAVLRGACETFEDALDAAQSVGVNAARAEWLLHMRYWHRTPKCLALMRLVEALPAPATVVDVGGGAGHVSSILDAYLAPRASIILDASLLFLLLGRWLAGGARTVTRVYCDGALPLPVVDGIADAIVSADAIHYMIPKASILGELGRIAAPGASVCLTHLHNAQSPDEPYQGFALPPAVWRVLCERAFGPDGVLLDDAAVRAGELATPVADSSHTRSLTYLRATPVSERRFERSLERAIVNPAYDVVREDGAVVLQRRTLSASYESEFVDGGIPARARITVEELADGEARARLRRGGLVIDPPPRLVAKPERVIG